MPQAGFGSQYFHEFPPEIAAAYLFHLVRNRAFIDGNKRVVLACAILFLKINRVFENLSLPHLYADDSGDPRARVLLHHRRKVRILL